MFPRWHPAWRYFGGSALLLAALVALLVGPDLLSKDAGSGPLIVHCAAGLRGPMTEIADEYRKASGQPFELRFDGSETLLNSFALVREGDIYLPADESYMSLAKERGIAVSDIVPVARQRAVLVVPARNPRSIQSWNELFQKKATIAQARPEGAAIGKLTRERLMLDGKWNQLDRSTTVYLPTVSDVVNAVALETVDAGIVWDALAVRNDRLKIVPAPELNGVEAQVQAGLLPFAAKPDEARKLLKYLSTTGSRAFRDHGFRTAEDR